MPRARREDVRHIHPRQRPPPHAVEAHVDVQHRGHRLARRWGRDRVLRRGVRLEERADDEEQRAHAHGRDEERHFTSERVDHEEHEDRGRDDFHHAVDPGREERVLRARVPDLHAKSYQPLRSTGQNRKSTHRREDLGRVISDRVLAAPLLQYKNHNSNNKPYEVPLPQERLAHPQALARLALLLNSRLDLRHLRAHRLVVHVQPPHVREVHERLVRAALGREPPRRLFDGEQAERHDPRGHELQTEGDAPDVVARLDVQPDTDYRPTVRPSEDDDANPLETRLRLTVDEVRNHDADGDHDLEETGDAPPDLLGAALRDVRGRDGRNGPNAETRDDAPRVDVAQAARAASDGLQNLRSFEMRSDSTLTLTQERGGQEVLTAPMLKMVVNESSDHFRPIAAGRDEVSRGTRECRHPEFEENPASRCIVT